MRRRADLETALHSSIVSINATSPRGRRWLRENVNAEGIRSGLETGCDCDARMAIPIIEAAIEDGLRCQDRNTGRVAERGKK